MRDKWRVRHPAMVTFLDAHGASALVFVICCQLYPYLASSNPGFLVLLLTPLAQVLLTPLSAVLHEAASSYTPCYVVDIVALMYDVSLLL